MLRKLLLFIIKTNLCLTGFHKLILTIVLVRANDAKQLSMTCLIVFNVSGNFVAHE